MITRFKGKAAAALEILEHAFEAATQVLVLPELYCRRLHTTNMCERLGLARLCPSGGIAESLCQPLV